MHRLTLAAAAALLTGLLSACGDAHPLTVPGQGGGVDGCTGCHGDAARTPAAIAPAPPIDASGHTATSFPGVGAHQAHLTGGPLRGAVACADCHRVPTSAAHANQPLDLTFGALAGGAGATYDTALHTCANYCHGSTIAGGSNKAPRWTQVDGTQAACGTCHGVPPPSPHPAVAGGVTGCYVCHAQTVRTDGTIDLPGGKHLDGHVDLAFAASAPCTACHGDANRTPVAVAPAPPRDTHGNTATTAAGVGAHQAHLTGTALRAQPIACSDCHQVPSDVTHAGQPLSLAFSALAGGTSASYDASAHTCANACHGLGLQGGTLTTPRWTKVDGTQAACGNCHGLPPPTGVGSATSLHEFHVSVVGLSCAGCHGNNLAATHINGVKDLGGPGSVVIWAAPSCSPDSVTACHGTRTWTSR